jgi:LysM repeat protein
VPYPLEPIREGDWLAVERMRAALARDMNPPVPQARVYNSANISLPTSGTFAVLTFDSEHYDNGSLHSTSANTSRLTVPITGLYVVGCSIAFASNVTGRREVALQVNGTNNIAFDTRPAVNGERTKVNLTTEYTFAQGDYVEIVAMQTSGGALNVEFLSAYSPEFWMHRVAGFVNQGV